MLATGRTEEVCWWRRSCYADVVGGSCKDAINPGCEMRDGQWKRTLKLKLKLEDEVKEEQIN